MSPSRVFCHVESAAFDSSEFESGPENTTIHAAVSAPQHTTDGWQAIKNGSTWDVTRPRIHHVEAVVLDEVQDDEEAAAEEAGDEDDH